MKKNETRSKKASLGNYEELSKNAKKNFQKDEITWEKEKE